MKIDVDGAEMGVLREAQSLLAQDKLELLFEVHTHYLPRFSSSTTEVLAYIRDRGFRCFRIVDLLATDNFVFQEVTTQPEALNSPTGDMLYVTKGPSRSVLNSLVPR